jgi:hypothetical protein
LERDDQQIKTQKCFKYFVCFVVALCMSTFDSLAWPINLLEASTADSLAYSSNFDFMRAFILTP